MKNLNNSKNKKVNVSKNITSRPLSPSSNDTQNKFFIKKKE